MLNKKFGKLTVLEEAGNDRRSNKRYLCKCDCGNEKIILGYHLKNGNTKSCGCLRGCTHGMYKSSEYSSWAHMKSRCCNPESKAYKNYGARGITVCGRWLNSFENFFADMGKKPSAQHSIDRINNNGNYCKSNCKWSAWTSQQRNRRDNKIIRYKGEKMLLLVAVEKLSKLKYATVWRRLNKYGWSTEDALEKPLYRREI